MIVAAKAFGRFLLSHREYLLALVLVAAIGAMWVQLGRAEADRDRAVATADGICAAAGSAWQPAKAKDADRGKACRTAVADLAAYKADTIAASAQLQTDAAAEQRRKADRDLDIARSAAQRAADAAKRMEDANAKVGPDDRVGGDWFASFNELVGMRSPARQ